MTETADRAAPIVSVIASQCEGRGFAATLIAHSIDKRDFYWKFRKYWTVENAFG
jgi:hypothetical protein